MSFHLRSQAEQVDLSCNVPGRYHIGHKSCATEIGCLQKSGEHRLSWPLDHNIVGRVLEKRPPTSDGCSCRGTTQGQWCQCKQSWIHLLCAAVPTQEVLRKSQPFWIQSTFSDKYRSYRSLRQNSCTCSYPKVQVHLRCRGHRQQ